MLSLNSASAVSLNVTAPIRVSPPLASYSNLLVMFAMTSRTIGNRLDVMLPDVSISNAISNFPVQPDYKRYNLLPLFDI